MSDAAGAASSCLRRPSSTTSTIAIRTTLAVGITLSGVQRFWCRGSAHDSRPGDVIVLDPGEVHDGRSGAHGGYAYRMLYIDAGTAKDIIADASGRPPRDLIGLPTRPRSSACPRDQRGLDRQGADADGCGRRSRRG